MTRIIAFFLMLTASVQAAPSLAPEFEERQAFGLAAEAYVAGSQARQSLLRGAEASLKAGHPETARLGFERWLGRHAGAPDEGRAYFGLARAKAQSGDYEGAAGAAREAVGLGSGAEGWRAALLEADAHYRKGRFVEADSVYEKVGLDWPKLPEPELVPYGRAWCQFRLGAMQRAAELFGQASELAGTRRLAPGAAYQKAECAYALGDWESAAKGYQSFEKRWPDHDLVPAARYSLAWCRFEQERWKDASTLFHRFSVVHAEHDLAPWGLYLAGVSLARANELDLAQSAYDLCLQKYPRSPVAEKARYGLAWLATMRKDYNAAAGEWTRFLQAWPDGELAPSANFLYGDSLYQLKRYAGAREQYLALLKRHPGHPLAEDALYYAANASMALGDLDQARDDFEQFLRLRAASPYAGDARRRLADCAFGLGRLDEAEKSYATLRKQAAGTPEAAEAAYGLGWVSFNRREWDASAKRFRMAATEMQGQESAEAWVRAGDAHFNAGQHSLALGAYRQAERGNLPLALRGEAYMGAGWAAYRSKEFDQALNEWGQARALALDPGQRAEAAYWMAWAKFRQDKYEEAANAYAEVVQQYPGSHRVPDALVQQANSLQNAGRCEEALPIFKDVAAHYPTLSAAGVALHGLQTCYGALGREQEALDAAKAYLKDNKSSVVAPQVQYQVAEHYLAHKDFVKAEQELDTLKSQYPGSTIDLSATFWRGQARFKNLKFNEAIRDWKDLVARAPESPLAPRALFKTGLAWYRLQEYGQAEAVFRKVIEDYGNTPDVAADAKFNLGLTYKRQGHDQDAIEAYQAVTKDHSGTELASMARIRIGYIYEDAGDLAKAMQAYSELAASDTGKLGAEAQYLVGDCLLTQKRKGEALLAYDAVAANFAGESGWVASALAKSGELLENLGRPKEALARYEKIMAQGGDPSWVDSARQRASLIRQRLGLENAPVVEPEKKAKSSKPAAKVKPKSKPKLKKKPPAVRSKP